MTTTQPRSTWYGVGYREGYAGKDERVPESDQARTSYRLGWFNGHVDLIQKAPFNDTDPHLSVGGRQ